MSSPDIINTLKKVKAPFNINSIALEAGISALSNKSFVKQSYDSNVAGLSMFYDAAADQM